MRSKDQALQIVVDTWTTIIGNPQAATPQIIFSDSNSYDTPYAEIERLGDEKSLVSITFPQRLWRDVSDEILRVETALEMVNYFLDKTSIMEEAMRDEIADAKEKHAKQPEEMIEQINLIRLKYEVELHVIDIQLARKLQGDEAVYLWFVKTNYNTQWLIDFFQFLITESALRIQPATRIPLRIKGLQTRIRHLQFLINGNTQEAEQIRNEQSALAEKLLANFNTRLNV